eukprot:c15740_g1_i1 orf=857-2131(-)
MDQYLEEVSSLYHQINSASVICPVLKSEWAMYQIPDCSGYPQLIASPVQLSSPDTAGALQRDGAHMINETCQSVETDRTGTYALRGHCVEGGNLSQWVRQGIGIHHPEFRTACCHTNVTELYNTGESRSNTGAVLDSIAHYPLEAGFSERAARFSSLTSENSPCVKVQGRNHGILFNTPSLGADTCSGDCIGASNTPFGQDGHLIPNQGSCFPTCPVESQHLLVPKTETPGELAASRCPDRDCPIITTSNSSNQTLSSLQEQCHHLPQGSEAEKVSQERSSGSVEEDANNKSYSPSKKRRQEFQIKVNIGLRSDGRNPKVADAPVGGNSGKRYKSDDGSKTMEEFKIGEKGATLEDVSSKAPKDRSPPKQDFIHVRARRGQATDSHSLAERVCICIISNASRSLERLLSIFMRPTKLIRHTTHF